MSTRPANTWNLEKIEILKGPASVLHGEGAVGGAINFVTKKPKHGRPSHEFLLGLGSFETRRVGLGSGGSVTKNTSYRIDGSWQESDGWVDRTPIDMQI